MPARHTHGWVVERGDSSFGAAIFYFLLSSSNPNQSAAAAFETTPPFSAFHVGDSPSQNTRSKSRASVELEAQLQQSEGVDYTGFGDFNAEQYDDIDFCLFGETADAVDDPDGNLFNDFIDWPNVGTVSLTSSSRSPKNKAYRTPSAPRDDYLLRSRRSS